MSKRLWGAALALGMGCTLASGPRSEAKPPDLPVLPQVTCPEGRVSGGSYSDHENGADVTPIPDLSWLGGLIPPMVEPQTVPSAATTVPGTDTDSREVQMERFRQAQRIYTLGLGYERNGHLSKARTCFQEAHLISPETRYGKLAMERLSYLEREHANGIEEAEQGIMPPSTRQGGNNSRQQFEDMRRGTTPLGTVPPESY